jgi:two-component system sensor histidine kinase KdpD
MESALFLGTGEPGERRLGDALGSAALAADPRERSVASWVLRNGREAGRSTDTLPASRGYFVPLSGTREEPLGVLGVVPEGSALARGQRRRLGSIANQVALALERELLSSAVSAASVRAESERLRADVLAAVSHDLRTPLATIQGAASTLLEREGGLDEHARRQLLQDVLCEAERLGRLVENLLQLGRVGDGRLEPRRETHPLDELVGASLDRLRRSGDVERIHVSLPEEPLLLFVDGNLLIQLVWNLLDNAMRYAADGPIELRARRAAEGGLEVAVLDRGPGLPPGDPERLFERFVRGGDEHATRGSGLGLAIGRAIARVHGGDLRAEPRPGGGAIFLLTLPPSCWSGAAGAASGVTETPA